MKQLKQKPITVTTYTVLPALLLSLCLGMGYGTAAWATTPDEIDSQDITNHLETEFWADDAVPSNGLDIMTRDGIVTLSGSVNTLLAKDRAQNIAEATVGVRSVINQIKVTPQPPVPDSKVKNAVEKAILIDPATDSYEATVSVNNGIVALTGTVDSWQEKQLCTIVAKGVKGVVGVKNQMVVDYATTRSDYEIKKDVEGRLKNDIRVDDERVTVRVKDGKVLLTGTVGSLREKTRARLDGWVSGTTAVDDSGLDIEWWARDEMRRKSLFVTRSDEEIKEAVNDSFVYDPRVFSFDIDADVEDGKVTLSGVVDNLEAKMAAETDAENTTGVLRVVNNLKVRPEIVLSDDELENKVEVAFLADPYIDRFDLTIAAFGGTVYLSGDVNTSWEKERASTLAQGVEGVLNVVNNIDFEMAWTWKPDWEIREDVKEQLFWSPFVDEDQISVTVDNGIVTLVGVVDTYGERQSAEENAFEGGAKDVKNLINVKLWYSSRAD